MTIEVGTIVTGKVVKVLPFGAFIQFGDKMTGLVHISEIARDYVENINDHIKIGDNVTAVVVKIDENEKISLSIKKAIKQKTQEPKVKAPIRPADIDWGRKDEENMSFEDRMKIYKEKYGNSSENRGKNYNSKNPKGYNKNYHKNILLFLSDFVNSFLQIIYTKHCRAGAHSCRKNKII